MQFTTQIPIPKSNSPIDYTSKIVSLGSCFAVNMAEKFDYFKFQNNANPFGILFHPLALNEIISRAINKQEFTQDDLFFHNEQWHCYDVHSDLSNANKDELLLTLNAQLKSTNKQITQSTHIIITYGTAWIYRNKKSKLIVANCHKVPQSQFEKEILSIEAIEKAILQTINTIQKVNPNCSIIFTVSPVRHIKDGFTENQRSKSHLISAIHQILNTDHRQLTTANCQLTTDQRQLTTAYFPSYEIMMDELRDYRFYIADMLHPSQVAIDYIWERFSQTNISPNIFPVMEEIASVQKSISHKPFNPDSESHLKFRENLKAKTDKLSSQFPFMKF